MLLIQIILISLIAVIAMTFLRGRKAAKARAWQKLLFLVFVFMAIVTIIWPEIMNRLASFLGVGRGADLLLYVLIVGFTLFVLNVYLRFNEMQLQITKLSRKIAISEAEKGK